MNNIKNKLVSKRKIEQIVNKYTSKIHNNCGYIYINNIKKFQKAFVHKSFCMIDSDNSDSDNFSSLSYDKNLLESNERLEFLGDKVIDLITTEYLFDKYPQKDEGFLTKLKSRLVKKESLSFLGEKLGFKDMIMISSHVERISGRDNPRFLEDIFESFMGILYKDQYSNLNICKAFLLGVYEEYINLNDLIKNNDNYKDSLLRYFHSQGWGHPVYKNIYNIGNVCSKEFTVIIILNKGVINKKEDIKHNIVENLYTKHEDITSIISNDLDIIKNKGQKECSINMEEFTSCCKDENSMIIGLGKGVTKKSAEQMCSKDCLNSLEISPNY